MRQDVRSATTAHTLPANRKETLMTEDNWNYDWKDCYKDNDYVVQIGRTKLGIIFRYIPNSLAGSEQWQPGLPEVLYFAESDKKVKRKPYHGIKSPKAGSPAEQGPELIMPRFDAKNPPGNVIPKAEVTVTQFIDSNPKTAFGAVKPGTFNTPPMPLYEYSLAHYQGALKYGHYNWREDPVSISTYINAARRHIDLYMEGQKYSSDTGDLPNGVRGVHNLAHSMTCLSIVMDAEFFGTLIDDRSGFGAADKLEQYFEEAKKLQQHLMKTWTGHAQQLKAKLAASKVEGK